MRHGDLGPPNGDQSTDKQVLVIKLERVEQKCRCLVNDFISNEKN